MSPESSISIDPTLTKVIPASLGALVSLRFVQGTLPERMLMTAGGVSLSYYATPASAAWLQMTNAEGLVGFVIGLFGMTLAAKVYEALQALDAAALGKDLWGTVKKRLGIGS